MDDEEWTRQRRKLDEETAAVDARLARLMTVQSKKLILDTFREVLVAADVAFDRSQSLNPSEALKYGVALVGSRMQDSHLAMVPDKYVEQEENDPERWYRVQSRGNWYGVRACCRLCAIKLLQDWTSVGHKSGSEPEWLVIL